MSLRNDNIVCEACRLSNAEVEIPSAPNDAVQPYRLCQTCASRLEELALRPSEWFNLAAIHGRWKYHLHDDFYDEDGKAYQANIVVERAVEFPIPAVSEIEDDIERLVDMAMSRWFFGPEKTPELLRALGQHDRGILLSVLQVRVSGIPNPAIESRAYGIAEMVLQSFAADWIRDRAETHSDASFIAWSCAAASCLPFEEGFGRVTTKLATKPKNDPMFALGALGSFRSSRTLDWMEVNVCEPLTDTWGRLAALSQFTWSRALNWLRRGRPLSLVALDALNSCWNFDTVQLRNARPRLLSPATRDEMTQALRDYASRDPKPRAERAARLAIEHLDEIAG
jgi:hypothetical protein